jgi:hypothetical protein
VHLIISALFIRRKTAERKQIQKLIDEARLLMQYVEENLRSLKDRLPAEETFGFRYDLDAVREERAREREREREGEREREREREREDKGKEREGENRREKAQREIKGEEKKGQ